MLLFCLIERKSLVVIEQRRACADDVNPGRLAAGDISLMSLGVAFTAIKRKTLRHFRSSRALKFESVQNFTSAKFV